MTESGECLINQEPGASKVLCGGRLLVLPVSSYSLHFSFTILSQFRLLPLPGLPELSRHLETPFRASSVEQRTSREGADRAGPDMAEGRDFVEPRGKERRCGSAAGRFRQPQEGTARHGRMGHSGSCEPSSPGRLGPGSWALFLWQRPSCRPPP